MRVGILDGKAAVVTGAAGLLGREYAKALAREGAGVVVNDVDAPRAESLVKEIEAAGGVAVADSNSVDSWDSAGRIIGKCLERFGRIDGLVTSAHRTWLGAIWELSEADLDRTLSVHVKGHFACVHHAARAMRERGSGSIVTVSSRALGGLAGGSTYAAAKGAIMSATFSWALELAGAGVRVNCINPAAMIDAGEPARHMQWFWDFPMERPGWTAPVPAAETVAPLVVYLLSDDSVWVNGQVIFLSGDTLALLRHPREERFAFRPEGWSLQDLRLYFRETVGAQLEMPGMDVPRYRWYGGLR
jgi:NAD(P)-dependent dehydrogenase (short-subunit alcohol dehydrogenase family)